MLQATDFVDAELSPLTDQEVRDNLLAIIVNGHETVATSVSLALYLLARCPERLACAQSEVDQVKVLPPHQPVSLMALALATMSLVWMWLAWRYRAIVAIITMHMAIDFLTTGHLHFTWFEPFQLIS